MVKILSLLLCLLLLSCCADPAAQEQTGGKRSAFLHPIRKQGLQIIRPDVLTAYGYGPHGGVV